MFRYSVFHKPDYSCAENAYQILGFGSDSVRAYATLLKVLNNGTVNHMWLGRFCLRLLSRSSNVYLRHASECDTISALWGVSGREYVCQKNMVVTAGNNHLFSNSISINEAFIEARC